MSVRYVAIVLGSRLPNRDLCDWAVLPFPGMSVCDDTGQPPENIPTDPNLVVMRDEHDVPFLSEIEAAGYYVLSYDEVKDD